jgi:hypothetical protein
VKKSETQPPAASGFILPTDVSDSKEGLEGWGGVGWGGVGPTTQASGSNQPHHEVLVAHDPRGDASRDAADVEYARRVVAASCV